MNKKTIFLIFLFLLQIVSAHEIPEAGINPLLRIAFTIWDFHDNVHWMIFIPFIGTCYYFRYITGRKIFSHPKVCGLNEIKSREYKGEFVINFFHRYFFWAMFILIFIHLTEVIAQSLGWITYNFTLFKPYIYPFSLYSGIMTFGSIQTLGIIVEWGYVLILLTFLLSCHFLRYFLGGKAVCYSCSSFGKIRGRAYAKQSKLNEYHGHLFGASILISLMLLLLGGHL